MTRAVRTEAAPSSPTRPENLGPCSITLLAEGDGETWDSWSGITRSVLVHLRALGHSVTAVNVTGSAADDALSKLGSFHWKRSHWVARHHFGPVGYGLRSRRATRGVRRLPQTAVLQIGATFLPKLAPETAFFLYCDANIAFSTKGGRHGPVRSLSRSEWRAVFERERSVYERANAIFTMSECARRSFVDDFGISPERVVTVHGGPNLNRIPDERTWPRPDVPPTVLFIGRQFERKGGPALVSAFRRVRACIPDARLLIGGCTPALSEEGVTVLGPLERDGVGPGTLEGAYACADLFCMPSEYEPFGVVFVEAMLHGIPCVGTDAWAMPEIIDHGRTGWVVAPGDVDALANALIDALRRRGNLLTIGRAARNRALERFTWSRVADAISGNINHYARVE